MVFSFLFNQKEAGSIRTNYEEPGSFRDLNLDQLVEAVTANKEEYNLKQYFYTPLHTIDDILYRQEVFRDLENDALFKSIKYFGEQMRTIRRYIGLAEKLDYRYQKERWFLEAVDIYCKAVACLINDLNSTDIRSRGLSSFRNYLNRYTNTGFFNSLQREARQIKEDLSGIKYCVNINGTTVKVSKYNMEKDIT